MPLQKELTHRLIKVFQVVLPLVIVVLIGVLGWNYWTKIRTRQGMPNLSKLPKEISLRTENFNFSKTEGRRTLFTIHADTNLGFSDDKNILQGVSAVIYGDEPSDPPRKLRADNCSYNQKTEDMECSSNVELHTDEATTVRTEKAVYDHVSGTVTTHTPSQIIRSGRMTGQANGLEYAMNSGLLKLNGAVKIHSEQGIDLEAGTAVLQEKENWATASDSVWLRSKNGWVRAKHARAELLPVTYQLRTIVVDGDVSSESTTPGNEAIWKLRSAWMQATLSPQGSVEHMLARTDAELTKQAPAGGMMMTGDEIETQMNDVGKVEFVEARHNARMKFGDDRLLTAETIRANGEESVSTNGASVLQVGEAHITGSVFSIQNGNVVDFHTSRHATLTQTDRVTSADTTDARFDNATNQLVSLVQSGHFTLKQADQTGRANKAVIENDGDVLTLEGAARVVDPRMQVEANTIHVDNKTGTKTASKTVKTVSLSSGERVLVTADSVIEAGDTATYRSAGREQVHLYRGAGFIVADTVEAPVGAKVFQATATGHVFSTMNNIRVWADRLEYDDGTHLAHYTGSVLALKQDMKIKSEEMTVRLNNDRPVPSSAFNESSVQEITADRNVIVTRSDSRGSGDHAVYDADTQQVVLTGKDAKVTDGQGTTASGPRITINVSGDKMTVVEASGKQRALTTRQVRPR